MGRMIGGRPEYLDDQTSEGDFGQYSVVVEGVVCEIELPCFNAFFL